MTNITNQPMYQKIKEDIMHQIQTGLLSPGDKLPTEYQYMQQYQVSRITISKALGELKKEGMIQRFPNKGSFVSMPQKNSSHPDKVLLSGGNMQSADLLPEIACIFPAIRDLFSLSMVNGILSAFPENEYICHFLQSQNPQIENYLLKRCLETDVAGIILFPQDQPFFNDELLFTNMQKHPLVLLDRCLPHINTNYVISDNQSAGELCVRHLHELGHKRIAFITTSSRNTFSIKYRLEGILTTADKLSIPQTFVSIIDHLDISRSLNDYQEMLMRLISEDKVTALIAAECHTCAYLYNLCSSLDIDIPGTLSLLSFDRPLTDFTAPDFFTYVNQSEYIMGREAGILLRQRLEQHDMGIYHKVIAPSLEVHRSTGINHATVQ